MSCKISIIGAGSAIFSLNLIKDICINENFKNCTVSLMDINKERLEAIYKLCTRYADEMEANITVLKTMDRREAMQGADFVINVALDYGHERFKQGIQVAYDNGYRFGGSLHVLHDEAFFINFHQLRLMESILVDMLDICPNAYYIMVANPVQAGVTYLSRKDLTLIRPLIYTREKEIKSFSNKEQLPVTESPCPADGNTERAKMKDYLAIFDKEHPGLYNRIVGAIQRGEVDGFHEDRIDQAEKLRRKKENEK